MFGLLRVIKIAVMLSLINIQISTVAFHSLCGHEHFIYIYICILYIYIHRYRFIRQGPHSIIMIF